MNLSEDLIEANTSYNVLLGRPCLNAFGAILFTLHLAMKFPSNKGTIYTVHADQQIARQCYAIELKIVLYSHSRKQHWSEVVMADLDPRTNEKKLLLLVKKEKYRRVDKRKWVI